MMIVFFLKKKKFRSQKIRKEILGEICWTSGSCFQKILNLILFERTPSKKQSQKVTKQKKNDRTKKVLQREMTNSKMSDFSTKNEK